MNAYKQIPVILSVLTALITGCEYDGPTAMYNKKRTHTAPPVITQMNPDKEAQAGVNYITISGERFSNDVNNEKVYIDGYQAEIVTHSETAITIRRPDRSGDATAVKISVFGALELAIYEPYKIDPVSAAFGAFLSGDELAAIDVDKNENVYIIENNTIRNIYKITPEGEKTIIGNANAPVLDATLAPNGNIVVFEKKKEIYVLDVAHGVDSLGVYATVSKNVTRGCFDPSGNLYTSGLKGSGLFVVKPDLSSKTTGLYASDEILCIRVHDNYLYLLVKLTTFDEANPQLAIWRHAILDVDGNLGDRSLVLDWAASGEFGQSTPNTFTFSDDGKIYVGTNYVHPIMFFDPQDGKKDIVYKGILQSSAEKLVWGNGHYLYMILGKSNWNLIRIDMGSPDLRDLGQ
jgi:hypothetical protein